MKMGQQIYEKEQASAGSPDAEAGSGGAEDDVVDAEFSEVDDSADADATAEQNKG